MTKYSPLKKRVLGTFEKSTKYPLILMDFGCYALKKEIFWRKKIIMALLVTLDNVSPLDLKAAANLVQLF